MSTATSSPRTVVVGGGVIGVATAYYLAKRGRAVTLVEQSDVGSGCSEGNAGQITPGHLPLPQPGTVGRNLGWVLRPTSPLYIRPRWDVGLFNWLWQFTRACNHRHLRTATEILGQLGHGSLELFEQLASDLSFSYQRSGRLEVCRTPRALRAVQQEAALLRTLGFTSRLLSGSEVHEFEPAVTGTVAGGVYYPLSAHCNPQRLVTQMAAAAEALGVEFRPNTCVTDVCVRSHRVAGVEIDGHEIEADAVVLACGSWSPDLARKVGLRLPIQPGKGYHLDIDRPAQCPRVPLVLVEERIFVTPIDDFLRLAGTMEFSGFNLKQNPARLDLLVAGSNRYLSGLDRATRRSQWCHLRPMTPDGLPVIGRIPGAGNLWIATGHGMLGLTQGPVTGKMIAELITTGEASLDLTTLRPDRFSRPVA